PRDAVAHGAGLAAFAAAIDVDHDVEARRALGQLERLAHHHSPGLPAEELVHRLAVYDEPALAGLEKHSRHRALAPPGTVVIIADHRPRSPVSSAAAPNAGASHPHSPSASCASRTRPPPSPAFPSPPPPARPPVSFPAPPRTRLPSLPPST